MVKAPTAITRASIFSSFPMALDGDDQRRLPLSMRKTNLARLLARRPDGIFVAPFEQGEIGPDLFRCWLCRGTKTRRSSLCAPEFVTLINEALTAHADRYTMRTFVTMASCSQRRSSKTANPA